MYSQPYVRAGKSCGSQLERSPSVIVVTEKVMREADGPVGRAALTAYFGWKGDRPGFAPQKPDGDEPVRSPKNTSVTRKQLTSRPDHLWPELWKSMESTPS